KLAASAKAGDKVTVIANKLTGAFEDQVAELEITVVDSTPEITDITFTSHETITSDIADFDLSELIKIDAKAAGSNEAVAVAYEVTGGVTPVITIEEKDSNVELGT